MKEVTIYTDGACSEGNPGPGGWGAILMYKGIAKRSPVPKPSTTNNRMEITAAIEALSMLKVAMQGFLYSDSAYLVNCFSNEW